MVVEMKMEAGVMRGGIGKKVGCTKVAARKNERCTFKVCRVKE